MRTVAAFALLAASLLGTTFAQQGRGGGGGGGGDDDDNSSSSSSAAATSTAATPAASGSAGGNSTSSALVGMNGDVTCTSLVCIGGVHNGSNTMYTIQSKGSATLGWMAVGFGQQMANSPMVILWPNSDGSITLSQRKAPAEVMPTVDQNPPRIATLEADLAVLSGSNPKISFTVPTDSNSDGSIIWAFSSTNPDSSAVDATLVQHLDSGPTKLDFTKTLAMGSSDPLNPISTIADAASPGGAPAATTPQATFDPPLLTYEKYIIAHAILMVIGFLFLLPIGALIARYLRTFSPVWFRLHWIIQWVLALPVIVAGFAMGVSAVDKMGPDMQLNDTHKKWGVAIFVLYFFQLSLGGFIHFVKLRFALVLGRAVQNYFHALFGIFLIGISFYQVRTGFRTEWPLYTGRHIKNGANIVWIIWLVLVCTAYFAGTLLLPRQFRQEREARNAKYGSDTGSTEPVTQVQPTAY
ncbi:CBD9-like protein [Phanerochaete sordida]|uniref:CBD9-like protein n=1 Tax=Phanerochaete sordida TaxID=48140 RepID=A0A9P3LDD3_9APHY|nr:CBD9-like protein [Phanerochaete sordida]